MPTTNGIPPISDYAHWNEDAERIWYEENKYDMTHPEVFDDYLNDPYDERNWDYDEEIPEDKCWELNRHGQNNSGFTHIFGPNADVIAQANEVCDDCGTELTSTWIPEGYRVDYDSIIVYREEVMKSGRKAYWTDMFRFPVFERIEHIR